MRNNFNTLSRQEEGSPTFKKSTLGILLQTAAVAALVLTGCARGPVDSINDLYQPVGASEASMTLPSTSSTPSPSSPRTPGNAKPILATSWVNKDGYTYSATFEKPTIKVEKSTSNARPGEVNLTWTVSATGTMKNSTEGRNSPFPNSLSIQPAWSTSSDFCRFASFGQTHGFSTNNREVGAAWCTVNNMPIFFYGDNDPAQGRTTTREQLPVGATIGIIGHARNLNTFPVPEDRSDAIIESLKNPELFAVGRSYSDVGIVSGACLLMTGVSVFAETSPTGCGVPPTSSSE